MVFIIAFGFGLFLGFKLKGALIFIKQAKDIKFIKTVIETVLSENEIKLYKPLHEIKSADIDPYSKEEFLKYKMQVEKEKLQGVN